ncbi:6-phospho 3-hexuloisomerase, putative [Babesia ovata]|uniref:6-phospho 3-hexuloisomerase, putative n=1 Tax=Babesia ovata TaxID=189622 RepID=A0A2H6KGD9_9APIC|nr:6-phospho 3-hexuloisomerase, putative [Babesia ovata]GBE62029.1 6-phospho 3-hexuloisomerase, putative [Babesia ovata]
MVDNRSPEVREAVKDLHEDIQDVLIKASMVLYKHYMTRNGSTTEKRGPQRTAKSTNDSALTLDVNVKQLENAMTKEHTCDGRRASEAKLIHLRVVRAERQRKEICKLKEQVALMQEERKKLRKACLLKVNELLSSFDNSQITAYQNAILEKERLSRDGEELLRRHANLCKILNNLKSCYDGANHAHYGNTRNASLELVVSIHW